MKRVRRVLFRVMDRAYEFGMEPGARRHGLRAGLAWSGTIAPILTCLIGPAWPRALATAVAGLYLGTGAVASFALTQAWDEHDRSERRE